MKESKTSFINSAFGERFNSFSAEAYERNLKKWLGMPQSGSWAMVHDQHRMAIKSITHLYRESRCLNLAGIRLFGDPRVRRALDSKETREAMWSRKFSSAIASRDLINDLVVTNPSLPNLPPIGPFIHHPSPQFPHHPSP